MEIICSICNKNFLNVQSFYVHLKKAHKMNLKQYVFQCVNIPICPFCKTNKLKIPNNIPNQFRRSGNFWLNTCGNKKCVSKMSSKYQKKRFVGENGIKAREKARQKRFEYLKKHTGQTAWERRSSGKMSFLEKWFFDNVIVKYKLFEKFDIINELPVYPYFIDFAFNDIKLAVELDGKIHFVNEERIQHDNNKDTHLTNKGWIVYRIKYDENNDDTISKFIDFLNNFTPNKSMDNKVYKYQEIKIINNIRKCHTYNKKCPVCGADICDSSKYCKKCDGINRRKVEHPSKEILQEEIQHYNFCVLGRKYGVSSSSIKKWCIAYGIYELRLKKYKHK